MSPAHETQSMREIRLLHGRFPQKGGGLTGMNYIYSNKFFHNCKWVSAKTGYISFLSTYSVRQAHKSYIISNLYSIVFCNPNYLFGLIKQKHDNSRIKYKFYKLENLLLYINTYIYS